MPLHENLRAILEIVRHDPLVVAGFCLIGAGAVFSSHVLLRMSRAKLVGVSDLRWAQFQLQQKYLQVREQHGWSAWPVYLSWICFALGIFALVAGLFLLHD